MSYGIKKDNFTLANKGHKLLVDTTLKRRYGLVGSNGAGKTTLLRYIFSNCGNNGAERLISDLNHVNRTFRILLLMVLFWNVF